MIVETVVSTISREKQLNFAPMGVVFEEKIVLLRPFQHTTTYKNLVETGEGVVNITDDVLVFARSALSRETFDHFPARCVRGVVLSAACAYYEFVVQEIREGSERANVQGKIVNGGKIRDFLGFNRGKNAVIEAAILATRLNLLAPETVLRKLGEYAEIVDKTAGEAEQRAMEYIYNYVKDAIKQIGYT